MTKIITDLQRFQVPYNFLEVPEIHVYLSQSLQSVGAGVSMPRQPSL
jgi:son of sevenless-like protein